MKDVERRPTHALIESVSSRTPFVEAITPAYVRARAADADALAHIVAGVQRPLAPHMRTALVDAMPALLTHAGAVVVPFLERVRVRPNAILHTLRRALLALAAAGAPCAWRRDDAEWLAYLEPFARPNESVEQEPLSVLFGWRAVDECTPSWTLLYAALVVGDVRTLADADVMRTFAELPPPSVPFARGALVVDARTATAIARGVRDADVAATLVQHAPTLLAALEHHLGDEHVTAVAAHTRDMHVLATLAADGRLAPSVRLARTWTTADVRALRALTSATLDVDAFVTAVARADVDASALDGLPLASARHRVGVFEPSSIGGRRLMPWLLELLEPADAAFAYSFAPSFVAPTLVLGNAHRAFAACTLPAAWCVGADAERLFAYALLTPVSANADALTAALAANADASALCVASARVHAVYTAALVHLAAAAATRTRELFSFLAAHGRHADACTLLDLVSSTSRKRARVDDDASFSLDLAPTLAHVTQRKVTQ